MAGMSDQKSVTIHGVEYVPAGATGGQCLCVLDRGWIFVGDLSTNDAGIHTLRNARNVRKWNKGGFGLLTRSREDSGAVLDDCADLQFTAGALIFCVPVAESW